MERFTTCKVELDLYDTTAISDSTLTANNIQSFSNLNDIKSDNTLSKIATLENNYFLLDGTFNYYDDVESKGYISSQFTTTITATFKKNHSSAGFTIYFWEMLPVSIDVVVKNGSSVLGKKTFNPKSSECNVYTKNNLIEYSYFIDLPIENYNYVEFAINGGDRFVRINTILYGIKLAYGEDDNRKLKSCTLSEEADRVSIELPASQSKIEIIDMDNLFKITNPSSYYKFLQERQNFKISETIDDTTLFMANHYLKEWNQTKEHSATFTLQDIIGLMSDTTFYGGMYNAVLAGVIFDEIFNDYGFTDYEIEEDIRNTVLTGYLGIMTHREALQQVAFACGACVSTSRVTGIKIFKPSTETINFIDLDRKILSNSEVTQNDLITSVNITRHNYVLEQGDVTSINETPNSAGGTTLSIEQDDGATSKEVYKGELEAGKHRVSFSNPSTNLSASGCTIINSGVNYADINVETAGNVVIRGNEYVDHTAIYSYTNIEQLPSSTNANIIEITNATLISESNVKEIAKLVYEQKQYRLEHKCKIITESEEVANSYALMVIDEYAPMLIAKMESDLTGGFISTVEGIGYALKIEEYYRAGTELYTGDDGGII